MTVVKYIFQSQKTIGLYIEKMLFIRDPQINIWNMIKNDSWLTIGSLLKILSKTSCYYTIMFL